MKDEIKKINERIDALVQDILDMKSAIRKIELDKMEEKLKQESKR